MQIVVNDLLVNYVDKGNGKALVFLHGWGDTLDSFSGLCGEFSKKYRTIAVDLPGFGKTQIPPKVWGLEDYAAFLKAFLGKIGVSEPYAVIGHSNGGAVLIKALGSGGLVADRLVLIAASGVRSGGGAKRLAFKTVAKTGKAATIFLPEKHKKTLRKKLYGVAGSDMLVVPHLQETFKKTVRQDVQADAVHIDTQTLLIYGTNDKATPVQDGKRLHQLITHSSLQLIDGAGHYVHHDEPDVVYKDMKEFLK